jgi:hypothetical protein
VKLQHLRYDACPNCKARLITEGLKALWDGNEFQEFECGAVIHWERWKQGEKQFMLCPKTAAVTERVAKNDALVRHLIAIVQGSDAHEDDRKRLVQELEYRVMGDRRHRFYG